MAWLPEASGAIRGKRRQYGIQVIAHVPGDVLDVVLRHKLIQVDDGVRELGREDGLARPLLLLLHQVKYDDRAPVLLEQRVLRIEEKLVAVRSATGRSRQCRVPPGIGTTGEGGDGSVHSGFVYTSRRRRQA